MNWRLIILSLFQSLLLASGQVTLKLAMQKVPSFKWTWSVIKLYVMDFWFLFTGIFFGSATILWMYILKNYPLSESYPLTSFAYVFGLLAAVVIFHESVNFEKLAGVFLILIGAFLLIKK